jgi:hypothetical protein
VSPAHVGGDVEGLFAAADHYELQLAEVLAKADVSVDTLLLRPTTSLNCRKTWPV